MTTTVQPTHSPRAHEALGQSPVRLGPADDDRRPGLRPARHALVVNVDQRPAAVLEVADVTTSSRPSGGRGARRARRGAARRPRSADHPRRHPAAPYPCPAGHRRRPGPADRHRRRRRRLGQLCDASTGTGFIALCGSNPDVTVVG